jgi:hypothetical protein
VSLLTRIERVEAAAAEHRAATSRALMDEFDTFTRAHWSEAEQEAFTRLLFADPRGTSDEVLAAAHVTRAELPDLLADVGPPTEADEAMVEAAWARLPAEFVARLWANGPPAAWPTPA